MLPGCTQTYYDVFRNLCSLSFFETDICENILKEYGLVTCVNVCIMLFNTRLYGNMSLMWVTLNHENMYK